MSLDEAIAKLREAAKTLQREKTEAAGAEFDRIYAGLQKQLTDEECEQLFHVLLTLYTQGRI